MHNARLMRLTYSREPVRRDNQFALVASNTELTVDVILTTLNVQHKHKHATHHNFITLDMSTCIQVHVYATVLVMSRGSERRMWRRARRWKLHDRTTLLTCVWKLSACCQKWRQVPSRFQMIWRHVPLQIHWFTVKLATNITLHFITCTTYLMGLITDVQLANIGIHSGWRKNNDRVLWWRIQHSKT